jgi:hypothetical protein
MSCVWVFVVTVGEFAVRRLSAGIVNHSGRWCLAPPLQSAILNLTPQSKMAQYALSHSHRHYLWRKSYCKCYPFWWNHS